MSFNWRVFFEENIWLIDTMILCVGIILLLLTSLQIYSGVKILPTFFSNTLSIAIVFFIFLAIMAVTYGKILLNIFSDAMKFLSFDYEVDRTEFIYNYRHWSFRYIIFSSLYFFILMVNFNFSGYQNEGTLMFLSWFGLMFLRVLHYFNGYIGREMGKFVIYLLLPLGVLNIIGHVFYLKEQIIYEKWPVFICVGLSFIFATLFVESIVKLIKYIWIGIKLKFLTKEDIQDDYELFELKSGKTEL